MTLKQQLQKTEEEFDKLLPKITPKYADGADEEYCKILTDVMNHPYKHFLRQAQINAVKAFAEEMKLEIKQVCDSRKIVESEWAKKMVLYAEAKEAINLANAGIECVFDDLNNKINNLLKDI